MYDNSKESVTIERNGSLQGTSNSQQLDKEADLFLLGFNVHRDRQVRLKEILKRRGIR